jgi:hypothetical protein
MRRWEVCGAVSVQHHRVQHHEVKGLSLGEGGSMGLAAAGGCPGTCRSRAGDAA